MRIFAIADASKRKARPVGILAWRPDTARDQGVFTLEAASWCGELDLPLSLAFCARRDKKRATPEESEDWARSRIVPESRHNIAEILEAHGLERYDVISLLAANRGVSSDDDFQAYELDLPDVFVSEIAHDLETGAPGVADKVIAAIERRRKGRKIQYAFVKLPNARETHARDQRHGAPAAQGEPSSSSRDGQGRGASGLDGQGHGASSRDGQGRGSSSRSVSWHSISGRNFFQADAQNGQDGLGNGDSQTPAQRIGADIRAKRKEAGLTQTQLAERAGVTQTVVSRIESGAGNPTLELLEEFAASLDMQLEVTLRPYA